MTNTTTTTITFTTLDGNAWKISRHDANVYGNPLYTVRPVNGLELPHMDVYRNYRTYYLLESFTGLNSTIATFKKMYNNLTN